MKRSLLIMIGTLLAAGYAGAQAAPSAGQLTYSLLSPEFLGGGVHITRTGNPQGAFLNPASAAGLQRVVLDLNYANLDGFGTMGGTAEGMGHAANAAISIPFRAGVLSAGFGFLDTTAFAGSAMDLGISGRLSVAFSKELYSDIWIGAGIDGSVGSLDGSVQGGAALSLGFLHFPKRLGALNNFHWGATLSGIGYGFGSGSRGYLDSIPDNITPAAGIAFNIVKKENFLMTFRSDVRLPSVTDLKLGIATDLYFGEVARMYIASSLDVRDAFENGWQTVVPSAALGVNFPLGGGSSEDDRKKTTEMDIQVAAAPLYDGVWAFAGGITLPFGVTDKKPPVIDADYESPQYISPNYDGIQDELVFPFSVTDERYIDAYELKVLGADGSAVRTFVNKDERPENETVKNLWKRTVSKREGTAIPENFRWDGIGDSGSMVPDGAYNVFFTFTDDNGNPANSGPYEAIVDTVAPELALKVPEGLDLIFSPDSDGLKDSLVLEQGGSDEHLWEAGFIDAGDVTVRGWAWADSKPPALSWDGKDDTGKVVVDGVYRYAVAATDHAGNATAGEINGIIIDTKRPGAGLSIDRSIFSPGTSSPASKITITPEIPVRTGIVDWSLEIVDSAGAVFHRWSRQDSPAIPESVDFFGTDSSGRRLTEGRYTAQLRIEYSNGFKPQVNSPLFTVDITSPSASAAASWDVFSPQGGSRRNNVEFRQTTSAEETWYGRLTDTSGKEVYSWTWFDMAPATVVWDGRGNDGRLAADGSYTYRLESVDRAGNRGFSVPVSVTVDTSTVEASVTASLDVFGPDGNGVRDTAAFFMKAKTSSPVNDWVLTVKDGASRDIRSWTGNGTPPENVIWNGKNSAGAAAPDGTYRAVLRVNFLKGDVAEATTGDVQVDTLPPVIKLGVESGLFSPDKDGLRDGLNITQSSSREDLFEASFVTSQGRKVAGFRWTGELKPFEWNGTDDSGNRLPDGEYSYAVVGTDRAGNQTTSTLRGIRIDTAATPVYLTANQGYVRAGETDPAKFQTFTAVVPNTAGIANWTFSIVGENRSAVYTKVGSRTVPGGFTWNGTDDKGRPVEGPFIGVLSVTYDKGSQPRGESRPFISDGSPPEVTVQVSPQPFSPDGDNVEDEAVISLSVEDRSRITEWSLEIFDPRGKGFITFSGKGRPSERIIWDGRSGRGELAESAEDYPYVLTVTDVLGLTAVKKGEIAVDVLVLRDGNRLKILINNITFQPNLPQLTLTGDEGAKNVQVLDRLAQIMQKYGSYRIVVEGHAVSLNWANAAAAEREERDILLPLSKSRAQTVVNELASRGITSGRLTAVGKGGSEPIVPHGDVEERWRNRRVEFFLEK